jgi:glycosidase
VYYGEEIGMTGVKPDEKIRTPMQWTGDSKSGFTTGTPWQAINANYKTINVAAQAGDANSLLEHYRRLILLRNENSALSRGVTEVVKADAKRLVAYLRASEDQTVLVIINVDDQPATGYTLTLANGPLAGAYTITTLFGEGTATPPTVSATGGFEAYTPLAEIPPYAVLVLELTPKP